MSGSKRVSVKTGSRLTISVSLEGLSELFGGVNLNEIVAYPVVYNDNDVVVHTPRPNIFTNDQTTLDVIITGEETKNWTVNRQYHMDVLFYHRTNEQRELSDTYYIDIFRGYARLPETGTGTGGYSKPQYDNDNYNIGGGV